MIVKNSPLQLVDIFLLNFDLKFNPLTSELNLKDLFNKYSIDLDFVFLNPDDNNFFNVYTKASINKVGDPLPGYSIFAECLCIYTFQDLQSLKDDEIGNFMSVSALPISINTLRNYISNITSQSILGRFNLPTIDVDELFRKKNSPDSNSALVSNI